MSGTYPTKPQTAASQMVSSTSEAIVLGPCANLAVEHTKDNNVGGQPGGQIVMRMSGEIDLHTASALLDAVSKQIDRSPNSLVLDLSALRFLGVRCLATLEEIDERATAASVTLRLVCGRVATHVLHVGGMTGQFNVEHATGS